ncbi:dual specificity protein phosphatase family protein [Paludisphaera rhizosphaerae]|uniref:dual specificity protein phosphatase family protein n=1 Tax=Paludisphaera rhizosphaerae TaxID=2711216 RepID=UPI0013EA207A|nr:dual specificity protein phosphatase family protein [Paludisphaera rhizosphaerae]
MLRRIPDSPLALAPAAMLRETSALAEAGVEAVVDLALNERPTLVGRELVACRFPLIDGEGNPDWLLRMAVRVVADLIREKVPTLVCCGNGMSRSPAVAAAALAIARGIAPEEALALVAAVGPADVSTGLWRDVRAVAISLRSDSFE